jgi:hypothetical protein
MELAPADPAAIPVHQLSARRLHLGPFGSGLDLAKFLCIAAVGAIVAALSSAVLWLPFLGVGAMVALVRVEGRTLDDYALGYCRFRWRTSLASEAFLPGPPAHRPRYGGDLGPDPAIRTGGVPIAYLPPADLQRLFEEWRSALAAFGRPIGCRMRAERFSPLPFLPSPARFEDGERGAVESYRELVRHLLRTRYRRVVDLTVWNDPTDRHPNTVGREADLSELTSALERLGIPIYRISPKRRGSAPEPGALP